MLLGAYAATRAKATLNRGAFQGALMAFSFRSALYNVVEIRPLFLQQRSSGYYR